MEMKVDLDKLITARKNKAWTQAHLAEVCGLSLRTIQRIENSGSASHDSIQALSAIFEIPVEDLIYKGKEVVQQPTEVFGPYKIEKLLARFGLLFMLIIPSIWLTTLLTGAHTNFDLSEAGDMSRFTFSDSALGNLKLLFKHSNISYLTLFPSIICFYLLILKFHNRKLWIRNSLIFSSILFFISSPVFGFVVLLITITILISFKIKGLNNN